MNAPIEVQLSRRKGWRKPPNTVSVARPGRFGNPFHVGDDYGAGPIDAQTAVELFRTDPLCEPIWISAKLELRGKNLACWCKLGTPCHRQILLKIANEP